MATGNALTVQSRAVSASEALATCSTLSNQGVYGSNSFTGATTGPYPVFKDLNWHSVHIDCRNVFVRRANLITCSGYYPKEPGAQHLRVKEKMLNDDGFPLLLPASESPLHKWVRPGTVVVSTLPTASVSDQGPNKTEESSNGTSSTWLLPYSISTDSVYTISATPGRNIPVGIEAGTTMSLAPSPGESGTMDGCALIPTTEVDTAVLSRIEESCNPSGTSTRDGSSVYACIQSGLHGASTTSQSESHGITDSPFATTVSSSQGSLPSTNKHCDVSIHTEQFLCYVPHDLPTMLVPLYFPSLEGELSTNFFWKRIIRQTSAYNMASSSISDLPSDLPPGIRSHISEHLYGSSLAQPTTVNVSLSYAFILSIFSVML